MIEVADAINELRKRMYSQSGVEPRHVYMSQQTADKLSAELRGMQMFVYADSGIVIRDGDTVQGMTVHIRPEAGDAITMTGGPIDG